MTKRIQAATSAAPTHQHEDRDYSGLLDAVRDTFATRTAETGPLFEANVSPELLWETYLDSFSDPIERKHHDCSCCKRFVYNFGRLVRIKPDGTTQSVMWDETAAPALYQRAFHAMRTGLECVPVTRMFRSAEKMWGTPVTGPWTHFSVTPRRELVHTDRLKTPGQLMAAKVEDRHTVARALSVFSAEAIDQAIRVVEAGAVDRAEKFVAPLKWLRALHDRPRGRLGWNMLWLAVATAPEGFCHPRSAVTGTLLEDIAAGMSFDLIRSRFNEKVAPLAYQRPQAAPAAGNIKAAEAIVEKLGIERSLARRYAQLEDLQVNGFNAILWKPKEPEKPAKDGVFGHLKEKGKEPKVKPVALPAKVMTWAMFSRLVLPKVERIEVHVPRVAPLTALVTALHSDAPPIVKWDREDARNPVSWYTYPGGSPPSRWGLKEGWNICTAIVPHPTMWGDPPMPFIAEGVIFVLEGCVDTDHTGSALFPELLRSELHEVRSVIEAHSKSTHLTGKADANAAGVDFRKGSNSAIRVRCHGNGGVAEYVIDRWE